MTLSWSRYLALIFAIGLGIGETVMNWGRNKLTFVHGSETILRSVELSSLPIVWRFSRSGVLMLKNVSSIFTCLLVVLFGQAIAHASQTSEVMSLTVPAAPWNLTLPRDGLVMERQQLKPDGAHGYFLLADNKNEMTISLFIEPATKCKSAKECRDMVLKLGNPAWENPQNVMLGEIGDVSYFEFFMKTHQGVPLQQQHMYAQFVVDGFWVDLHVSKTQYKPEQHVLFLDRVKSIKFETKKQTEAVTEGSATDTPQKAAEAWLLLWDSAKHDEVHERASKQSDATRRDWYVRWYGFRRSLGNVKLRKLLKTSECREEKDKCAIVFFETSFENRNDVTETLILRRDSDLMWRVFAYLNNASPY